MKSRWTIAAAGVLMQIALGAVYAWSVFRTPLTKAFGWTISQVTLTFTIAIFTLGITAFFGGLWMRARGPRIVGITAGILYGLGVFLAGFSNRGLWVLYVSYGIVGGAGIGLGYIVPIATLVKWFPERRGFITGIAVAGFGAGALVTAPLANRLIADAGVLQTFRILGIAYFFLVVGSSIFMANPPPGRAAGAALRSSSIFDSRRNYTLGEALRTWQWYGLWTLLFLNVTAGISIISQAAPMAEEITGASAAAAAGMVGIISIANGGGRFLWAWLSDFVGRRGVFAAMFLLQAGIFFALPRVSGFGIFTALALIILLCYGGGFGTMPAFCSDYFGTSDVGSIYGLMLTAWGFGSAMGPLLIAQIRETTGHYNQALYAIAAVMLVSSAIPFIVRPPSQRSAK